MQTEKISLIFRIFLNLGLTYAPFSPIIPLFQAEAARFSPMRRKFCTGHGISLRMHWRGTIKVRRGVSTIAAELLINEEIRDREVRVIGADGAQLGIMPTKKALELAEEAELDLVKIVPNAAPPVCKLMDYDKHRYEQSKREREMRKNQKDRIVSLKEVQLSTTIEENDVAVKAKNAVKFLQNGDKVKVSIRFRGRQIAHSDIGLKVMTDFAERLNDLCTVERRPMIEGRNMIMVLAPKAEKAGKAEKAPKAAPAPQA